MLQMRAMYEPLFERIKELLSQKPYITVALDGMSAAGKSSLAAILKTEAGASLILADDFFLRPHQRTPRRLEEPGGFIDYERFSAEVSPFINGIAAFTYGKYDCKLSKMAGEAIVHKSALYVVEGVYSLNPKMGLKYDISVFMEVSEEEQRQRILKRGGEALLARFEKEWLPKERLYFDKLKVRESCDFIFKTG